MERYIARGRALVTGGTGFVGSHLVDQLLSRGYAVTCLLRRTSDRRHLLDKPVELIEAELIGNSPELSRIVSGHDVVFHVAGAVRALSHDDFRRANATATEDLVTACLEARKPPGRFVLVSSVAACGPPPEGEILTERHAPRPITDYGRSKLEGERRALRFSRALPLIIVRPTAIYGPRDREMLSLFRLARSGVIPAMAGKDQLVNLCHVEDIVRGIVRAGEVTLDTPAIFLLGAQREHTMTEVADAFSRLFARRVRLVGLPRPLLRSAALCSEAWARLRQRPAMLNRQKVPELVASWRLDLTAARHRLGFDPRWDLPAGIANTLQWYQNAGWLEGQR